MKDEVDPHKLTETDKLGVDDNWFAEVFWKLWYCKVDSDKFMSSSSGIGIFWLTNVAGIILMVCKLIGFDWTKEL